MWTTKDFSNVLTNINAVGHYKDDELMFYQLYPAEGYLILVPGAVTVGEIHGGWTQYLTEGGATAPADYDFTTNPFGFEAVLKEAE